MRRSTRLILWTLWVAALGACGSSHAATTDAAVDAASADAMMDTGLDAALPACPTDIAAADGMACPVDGQSCGNCPGDACSFCNQLYCDAGIWMSIEAFPAPCHDCGSAGQCVSISQYCDVILSDVAGVPDSYQCLSLPDACLGDLSCDCLLMSGITGSCSGAGTTGLTVQNGGA